MTSLVAKQWIAGCVAAGDLQERQSGGVLNHDSKHDLAMIGSFGE